MPASIRVDNVSKFTFQISHSGSHKRVCEINSIKPGTPRLHLDDEVGQAMRICSSVADEQGYDQYYYRKAILS